MDVHQVIPGLHGTVTPGASKSLRADGVDKNEEQWFHRGGCAGDVRRNGRLDTLVSRHIPTPPFFVDRIEGIAIPGSA